LNLPETPDCRENECVSFRSRDQTFSVSTDAPFDEFLSKCVKGFEDFQSHSGIALEAAWYDTTLCI